MSLPGSPSTALVPLQEQPTDQQDEQWRRIFQASNAVVLYNPTSHALAFHDQSDPPNQQVQVQQHHRVVDSLCPYCNQPLPPLESPSRAPNYFHLLSLANDVASESEGSSTSNSSRVFPSQSIAQGYFAAFFKEEYRLGMGANGSVYLCQHVLNGNPLGYFAVKKVAVGESSEYLANLLQEVRLLETLHHPNIISYHHAWLESCQFSSFGPSIPTLHILMQWAEGGSLDEYIDARLGKPSHRNHFADSSFEDRFQTTDSPMDSGDDANIRSRSARIRAFRNNQRLSSTERNKKQAEKRNRGKTVAVHLFSGEEIKCIFSDVVGGLGFLHGKSILHLDLKPLNVLLTWDEGSLIPRAMLSDFGTSQDMLGPSRVRSGNTGTLEYSAPETIARDANGNLVAIDSRSDMWSLGMVLYRMVFFSLPWNVAVGGDSGPGYFERLEEDLLDYPGFKTTPEVNAGIRRRGLPRSITVLLESLLNVSPFKRPTCEQVITAIREGKLDPLLRERQADEQNVSLVPLPRKTPSPTRRTPETESGPSPSPPLIQPRGAITNTELQDEEVAMEREEEETTPTASPTTGFAAVQSSMSPPSPPLPLLQDKPPLMDQLLPPPASPYFNHILRQARTTASPEQLIKALKSLLVLVKLFSLYHRCGGFPSARSVGIVVSLGILDTWFMDWWSLVYFGIVHVVLLYIFQGRMLCSSALSL